MVCTTTDLFRRKSWSYKTAPRSLSGLSDEYSVDAIGSVQGIKQVSKTRKPTLKGKFLFWWHEKKMYHFFCLSITTA